MVDIELQKNKDGGYSLLVDGVNVGSAWVGHTNIVPVKDFMNKKSKVVMGFHIKGDHRQKGFGQILMDKINESEKIDGTECLRLRVDMNNEAAIKIYERSGFIKDGLVHGMHYMWKKL
jgi:ribosomal protein S18 acetylase RimI-like enzyme